jgi:glycyl-tRNA synthetase beta chain
LLAQNWSLDFSQALPALVAEVSGKTPAKLPKDQASEQEIADFIRGRVKQFLQTRDYQYDVIDAVLASSQQDPQHILQAAKVLQDHHDDADFKPVVESLTRINNILAKGKFTGSTAVDAKLFTDESEQELADAVSQLQKLSSSDLEQLYAGFVALEPVIDRYFNTNMIMDKDLDVRRNRLAQLAAVSELADRMGDLSKLVIK